MCLNPPSAELAKPDSGSDVWCPTGSSGPQDLPLWMPKLWRSQDGGVRWGHSKPVVLWFPGPRCQHPGDRWNVSPSHLLSATNLRPECQRKKKKEHLLTTFYFLSQLGGLPVPWLPGLPVCPGNGAIQALEWMGSPPAPDPVHPQGEGHADAPQGLLRDERLERPDRVHTGQGQACTAANHPIKIHEQPLSHTS